MIAMRYISGMFSPNDQQAVISGLGDKFLKILPCRCVGLGTTSPSFGSGGRLGSPR